MGAVVTRHGRKIAALAYLGQLEEGPESTHTVKLVVEDFEPTPTLALGDVVEASFGGYAPITRAYQDGTGPVLEGDDQIDAWGGAAYVWDCTSSPETVYGYVIVRDSDERVLASDRYTTPHVLEVGSRHTLFIDLVVTGAS